MKLNLVITASYYQNNVTIWLNPGELRWNHKTGLWEDKHAGKFERRRDEFKAFEVESVSGSGKPLPAHGSMDALKVVMVAQTAEHLESVSYLKPLESLGEM